ncbi:MAG: hypothetical protein LBN06_02715 [Prevotellaceae bacterium]|jgi:hypothetical protein|nr:hypothetical protein [Prevotellaceae bacterium]
MKLNSFSSTQLEDTLKEAVSRYLNCQTAPAVTDIHLQAVAVTGEFIVFDDDDCELATNVIEEWMTYTGDKFYKEVERLLSNQLHALNNDGMLDRLNILKPYSFVLVDEEKETVAELLLIDDDTLLVNKELLKGLDRELDDFLKALLEE